MVCADDAGRWREPQGTEWALFLSLQAGVPRSVNQLFTKNEPRTSHQKEFEFKDSKFEPPVPKRFAVRGGEEKTLKTKQNSLQILNTNKESSVSEALLLPGSCGC